VQEHHVTPCRVPLSHGVGGQQGLTCLQAGEVGVGSHSGHEYHHVYTKLFARSRRQLQVSSSQAGYSGALWPSSITSTTACLTGSHYVLLGHSLQHDKHNAAVLSM
jgi:hypothetical protein